MDIFGALQRARAHRLFRYLVDYAEFSEEDRLEGLFFHLSSNGNIYQKVERIRPRIAVHLLNLNPENVSDSKEALKKLFSSLIVSSKH